MSGYPPQPYILQSGTITPGHGLVWAANGVVEDSGSPPIDLPSGPEGYYLTASGLPGTVVYVQPNSAGGPAILDSNDTLSEQLVIPAGTTTALSLATIAASQVANGIPAGSSGALLGLTGVAGIGQSVTTLKNLTIAANASAFPTVAIFRSTFPWVTATDGQLFDISYYAAENDCPARKFKWVVFASSPPSDNGGTVLNPTGNTTNGRAILQNAGPIDVRAFGMVADFAPSTPSSGTDNSTAWSNALAAGIPLLVAGGGHFKIVTAATVINAVFLYGDGATTLHSDNLCANITASGSVICQNVIFANISTPTILPNAKYQPTVNSPGYGAVSPRSTAVALDYMCLQGGNNWAITTAGTTAASAPTFPGSPSVGATVTDGTAVWTYLGTLTQIQSGLSVSGAESVLVSECQGVYVTFSFVSLTGPAMVANNIIQSGGWGNAQGTFLFQGCSKVSYFGNSVSYGSFSGVNFRGVLDSLISGNRHDHCGESGYKLDQSYSTYSIRNLVTGNKASFCIYDGFDMSGVLTPVDAVPFYNQFIDNESYLNGFTGFVGAGLQYVISGNIAYSNGLDGFQTSQVSSSLISENTAYDNVTTEASVNQLACNSNNLLIGNKVYRTVAYTGGTSYNIFIAGANNRVIGNVAADSFGGTIFNSGGSTNLFSGNYDSSSVTHFDNPNGLSLNGTTISSSGAVALGQGSSIQTANAGFFFKEYAGGSGYANGIATALHIFETDNNTGAVYVLAVLANGGSAQNVWIRNDGSAFFAASVGTTLTTVAGLSSIVSPYAGMRAAVSDATSPTFLGALTGGGSVKCPVFYNGSAWVAG